MIIFLPERLSKTVPIRRRSLPHEQIQAIATNYNSMALIRLTPPGVDNVNIIRYKCLH